MRSKTQGYLVLALGPTRYLDMAINLAASIRVIDPGRPICLVHDVGATIPAEARGFFDDFVELVGDQRYPHVMNKIRLFELSPYAGTMFVDADCLLVKPDIDHYWTAAATRPFSITGGKRTSGEWKGIQIEDVLKQEGADYLIQMNAGVFYFDKSAAAHEFFQGLEQYYLDRMERLNITNYKGPQSQSFELYLGIFMGLKGMDSENIPNIDGNSWMVSTWRAAYCDFNTNGRSVIYKLGGYLFDLPFLPSSVTRLSPTFAHFIGLKPRRVYDRVARQFRALALAQQAPRPSDMASQRPVNTAAALTS